VILSDTPVISIIDDDPLVRDATNDLIRALGYRAETFASAEEFLRSERMNDTACLITDVQMPGLSGIELQTTLIARGSNTPIIFVTAFPEERIRRRALEAGAIGFLSKPFDEERLIEYLDTALNSRQHGHAKPEPTVD
jgi:FixJ family two-component response regulator